MQGDMLGDAIEMQCRLITAAESLFPSYKRIRMFSRSKFSTKHGAFNEREEKSRAQSTILAQRILCSELSTVV